MADLDAIMETELNNLGIEKPSAVELGGLSKLDKDAYIESLLKEINELKLQLQSNKSSSSNLDNLEEFDNIELNESSETITLKAPEEGDDEEAGGDFDPNNILNMLGAFMNNDALAGDGEQPSAGKANPMMHLFSKMMEGMNENMQSTEGEDNGESEESIQETSE